MDDNKEDVLRTIKTKTRTTMSIDKELKHKKKIYVHCNIFTSPHYKLWVFVEDTGQWSTWISSMSGL